MMTKENLCFFIRLTNQCPKFDQIDAKVLNIARMKTFQYFGICFDETMKWKL